MPDAGDAAPVATQPELSIPPGILVGDDARAAWRWEPFFLPAEFECRCCHGLRINPGTMDRLVRVRKLLDRPLFPTSGYRCPRHNCAVSGTGQFGPHTTGQAVDLQSWGGNAYRLVRLASEYGFTGIGLKQTGSIRARFVHLDDLAGGLDCPRPWIWTY